MFPDLNPLPDIGLGKGAPAELQIFLFVIMFSMMFVLICLEWLAK